MPKMKNKKMLAAVLGLAMCFSGVGVAPVMAAENNTTVAVQVEVKQVNKMSGVNWTKGAEADVTAMGIGLPPVNAGVRGTALARRAARVDAQRNLLEIINGVQIDSDTTVEDLTVTSDFVRSSVSGLIKGARIIDEGVNDDGSYFVIMSVPLYGSTQSLAASVLPEATKNVIPEALPTVDENTTTLTKEEVKMVKSVAYTGVIVDASGLGLEPTFSPVIFDTNGRAIYGVKNIDKDKAISQGMVEYSEDLQMAAGGTTRAGANPLVVRANAVRGGRNSVNPVNVVVSVEDGDKILLANAQSSMLENCAVVFVK